MRACVCVCVCVCVEGMREGAAGGVCGGVCGGRQIIFALGRSPIPVRLPDTSDEDQTYTLVGHRPRTDPAYGTFLFQN